LGNKKWKRFRLFAFLTVIRVIFVMGCDMIIPKS